MYHTFDNFTDEINVSKDFYILCVPAACTLLKLFGNYLEIIIKLSTFARYYITRYKS